MCRKYALGYPSLLVPLLISFLFAPGGLALTPVAAPGTDEAQAATAISAEQAIAIATGGEVGENDFRISDMARDFNSDASAPAVAYSSTHNEYLVVWEGDDGVDPLADNESEIFAQRMDAATGAKIGIDFRLSDMGTDGDANFDAFKPAVAYNDAADQYLVVWQGDDTTDSEFEIYGQRIEAGSGAEIGADFRISDMGPDGNTSYGAFTPDVAYNSRDNEYLVVWRGDDNLASLVDNEYEIFGHLLDASGGEIGSDFRISDMGPDGSTHFTADVPAVAYNSVDNEYLVVWIGDDDTAPLVDGELEVFGQRLTASGGHTGNNDFRISDMGLDGDANSSAYAPDVVHNSAHNQYLVVWTGDDGLGTLADDEYDVYGQRLTASGGHTGRNDFRISAMGSDGDARFDAWWPAVTTNSADDQYLVVWYGDDDSSGLADDELEIYGQRLDTSGNQMGADDFRISDTGTDGDDRFDAHMPAVTYASAGNQYLVVWQADDDTTPLVDEESEIFGQRLDAERDRIGSNDFRISDMGRDLDYLAFLPDVTYNGYENEYLVVWAGHDNRDGLADDEIEIYGQRLDAATGEEVGTNDFRISDMGPDGNPNYTALFPAVAYSSVDNQYLVIWMGDDDTAPLVDEEFEVFGQRLTASGVHTGNNDFRISDMGPAGNPKFGVHYRPGVAYNSTKSQYLVVWAGDDIRNDEFEIFGQRLEAGTGQEIGSDFRISEMGPHANADFSAHWPAVAYNSADGQYLVVWEGDDDTFPLVDEEFEIYGQRLDSSGHQIGADDFRISDLGPPGDADFDASSPAVGHDSTANQYLVVWHGDDEAGALVDDEFEIYGQRLDAGGNEIGGDDFRISHMGTDGDPDLDGFYPGVVYNYEDDQYLVAWTGDDDTAPLVDEEFEVFVQQLDAATGSAKGRTFRISDMGPDGEVGYFAGRYFLGPRPAFNSAENQYLVVWSGLDTPYDGVEIYGQRYQPVLSYTIYLPIVTRDL